MTFWASIVEWTLPALQFIWQLFLDWLFIFISPLRNLDVLWIIIPVWFAWFFAEFFQEKKGTSFGNAISNGVIPVWVAIDWTRLLVNMIRDGKINFSWILVIKFAICLVVFIYGIIIITQGIKSKDFIHYAGKIRVATYILVMFTPLIYDVVELTAEYVVSIIIFFPVFYYFIELIDRLTPNPVSLERDEMSGDLSKNTFDFSAGSSGGSAGFGGTERERGGPKF